MLYCRRDDIDETLIVMPEPGAELKFSDYKAMEYAPFVVYADFEALTTPIDQQRNNTTLYQQHVPCSVGLFVKSRCQLIPDSPYMSHRGED